MSILNLNTPQGQGPIGKKKTKVWMGVGLLVAVLGLGSTFASNITLNSSAGTEFGQGVTQTVFCGGNSADVAVTPISSYSNTEIVDQVNEVTELSFYAKFGNSFYQDTNNRASNYSTSAFVEYSATSAVTFNGVEGWWLASTNSQIVVTNTSLSNLETNKLNYVFSPKTTKISDSSERSYSRPIGFYKVSGSTPIKVVTRAYVAPTPASTKAASFKLGGVSISGIPSGCAGVDFVLSAYSETGTARTMISTLSPLETVKEVAIYKRTPPQAGDSQAAIFSVSRSSAVSSELLTVTETSSQIDILFDLDLGVALDSTKLYKLVVETQEHKSGS
jgi:hypothetical protein